MEECMLKDAIGLRLARRLLFGFEGWPLSCSPKFQAITMAPQETAPQWDDLFQIKGKVALVTGGSRGERDLAL